MLAAKEIVSSIRMSWVPMVGFCGGALCNEHQDAFESRDRTSPSMIGGPELPYHVVAIKRGSRNTDSPVVTIPSNYMTSPTLHHHTKIRPLHPQIAGKEDYADVRNVMIMGGSRIRRTHRPYVPDYMQVKIVDNDLNRCNRLTRLLDDRTMIINGDGRDMICEGLKHGSIRSLDRQLGNQYS